MTSDQLLEALEKELGIGRIKLNKDISPYFTLRTLTTAEYFFEAETRDDLIKAVKVSKALSLPIFILGGGSNVAVTHSSIPGLVIRNLYQKKEVIEETDTHVDLLLSSGYSIARTVAETTKQGWEGFEYHLGLPGTIGGSLYMNSKWTKPISYIGDSLLYAYILAQDGEIKKVERPYFQFDYDYSILQKTKEVVLEAVFRLKKNDPQILQQRAKESFEYRRNTQPHGVPTAGCFFQNVNGKSAGQMIDQAGFKNKQIGDFIVSDKHANFIINKGKGEPEDLLKLIQTIKDGVKEKFGVELKEEVLVI